MKILNSDHLITPPRDPIGTDWVAFEVLRRNVHCVVSRCPTTHIVTRLDVS